MSNSLPNNLVDFQSHSKNRAGRNGGSGGGGMNELIKRMARAEDNIADIKLDLARLTTRSEEFATKGDIFTTKNDIQALNSEMHKEFSSVYQAISNQTKWIAATLITVATLSLAIARFLFN